MLLPTGEVLFSPSSSDVECYEPDGGPQDAWRPVITSIHRSGKPAAHHYRLNGMQLTGLSQANIYGDDCNPSTNYPLVRLRNHKTDEVFYARTYDFSTRAVSTPSAPQSVRFSAEHIPYGHYEICVVANGISSHCVHFDHNRPEKPCGCDDCRRHDADCTCHDSCKRDWCCEEEAMLDPELVAMRAELKSVQHSIRRLSATMKIEKPHREPKDRKKVEDADESARARQPRQPKK